MNPLKIYPDGSPLARQYRQFQASNPPADDGGDGGGAGASAEPIKINRDDPTVQFMLSVGYVIETDENGNEKLVQKGEPMDMAWRMLKGELQLPHQITEALRGDLTTLTGHTR